jgi:hypothetical protein
MPGTICFISCSMYLMLDSAAAEKKSETHVNTLYCTVQGGQDSAMVATRQPRLEIPDTCNFYIWKRERPGDLVE